jgi:hypothetical protein
VRALLRARASKGYHRSRPAARSSRRLPRRSRSEGGPAYGARPVLKFAFANGGDEWRSRSCTKFSWPQSAWR